MKTNIKVLKVGLCHRTVGWMTLKLNTHDMIMVSFCKACVDFPRGECSNHFAAEGDLWIGTYRAVASLTVPGGQEFHFPHFFLKFWSNCLTFPQTLLIFFLILALLSSGGRLAHPRRPWLRHWVHIRFINLTVPCFSFVRRHAFCMKDNGGGGVCVCGGVWVCVCGVWGVWVWVGVCVCVCVICVMSVGW